MGAASLFSFYIVGLLLIPFSEQNPLEPYFRKDYEYIGRQEAFYKTHNIPLPWNKAEAMCAMEGAALVYPVTQDEASLMCKNLPKGSSIWLGGHDIFAEGFYVNLEGHDVSKMYSNWSAGEPNNANENEDCIAMTKEGALNDYTCNNRLPFVCKKSLSTLTSNPTCETHDLAYVPNKDKTRCYKVHTVPKNWSEAFATCHAEQSYLTVINNEAEANFLLELLQKTPEDKIKVPYSKTFVAVGFHDLYNEAEYLTVQGQTLEEAGYNNWSPGQPDNYKVENCGSITRQGKLNDISCTSRMIFICERDLENPNVSELFSRFQGPPKN